MKSLKRLRILMLAVALYVFAFILKRDLFYEAVHITAVFFKEMLQVLPPVLVLSALITVWVPSAVIEKRLGSGSGIKGKILSALIGSLSAGPIYAAFPAALVLFKKGASISNIVIILSSWAVIKIPMLFVEANFLGIEFTVVRFILTLPAILFMGYLIEKMVRKKDICQNLDEDVVLPDLNCGGCGYNNCSEFKNAVLAGDEMIDLCIALKKSHV